MCGIASIFAYNHAAAAVDKGELLRIRDAMINRGPDGAGLWISADRRVGLAHRRLSIIDLSDAGAQPMATDCGRFRITFNGEIYNYRELRRALEGKGIRFRSTSDTEVLLYLYVERGVAMVDALRGMYAFAIWDECKQGLFLGRDPFGIKPLYYCDDGSTVRVASQVKALLGGGGIDPSPEPAGHVGFFLWGHVPDPYTLHKGIRALPAGSSLWIDTAGPREIKQFFCISDELAKASDAPPIAREEMQERLRAALLDSIRHHTIADVPVGVFLSAGLDSSTITALAREVGNSALHTVTLGFGEFEGTHNDETQLASLVAEHYGTLHRTCWVTKGDFQRDYRHLLQAMDQPSTDGVNSYFISKAAAETGLKVVLSGLGGDELFGGYPSFRQVPAMVRALSPFQAVSSLAKGFRYLSAPILKHFTSPKYGGLLEYGGTYEGAYLLRRGMFMPWELPNLLDGELVRKGWQELQTLTHLKQTIQGVRNAHLRVVALETAWYMRNQLLRDADWAGMAHSIEIRVPLVDIELFRNMAPLFNAPCPPGKLAMAQAPVKPLPIQIVQREKSGFSIPVVEWLMPSDGASAAHRGLRQWATIVYRESTGEDCVYPQDRRPVAAIFRTGQLGDTLMALPAIELIRRHLPKHRLVLLTDCQPSDARYVSAWDICKPTGWFDGVVTYEPGTRGWCALESWASMLLELRSMNVDQFYNMAAGRSRWQAMRDEWFFSGMVGARHYHAPVPRRNPGKDANRGLHWMEPEWRHTLRGIGAEHTVDFKFRLPISDAERDAAARVVTAAGVDFGARLLAFGPGSKMPAKIWPVERFAEVGMRVQKDFPDLQFVILGGQEDATIGRVLCSAWGERAHNLAGKLSIFGSAAILERCIAYVGNDTGTMHLAAMAGIPCVAIFSARDYPGRWDPYGAGHTVLRHEVACAGCLLEACEKFENKCLKLIGVDEVYDATSAMLARVLLKPSAAQSLPLAPNASKSNFKTVDC